MSLPLHTSLGHAARVLSDFARYVSPYLAAAFPSTCYSVSTRSSLLRSPLEFHIHGLRNIDRMSIDHPLTQVALGPDFTLNRTSVSSGTLGLSARDFSTPLSLNFHTCICFPYAAAALASDLHRRWNAPLLINYIYLLIPLSSAPDLRPIIPPRGPLDR